MKTFEEFLTENELLSEEFDHEHQAIARRDELRKKYPNRQYTHQQGRKSGKWHVMHHTSGGSSSVN